MMISAWHRCAMSVTALALTSWSLTAAQQGAPTVSLLNANALRIGRVEGPPESLFNGIVNAILLPNGELAVADGGAHVIRFFNAAGVHLRSIGREGSGPGEFKALRWIGYCGDGELLAIDGILSRATFFSAADGAILRSATLPPGVHFDRYVSCMPDRRLVVLVDQPAQLGEKGKVTRFPALLVQYVLGTESRDTLARLPGTDFYFAEKVPGYVDLPLGAKALAAMDGGRLYFAQNIEPGIHVIDIATGKRGTFSHGLSSSAVSSSTWSAAKAERVEREPLTRTRKMLVDVLAEAPQPDRHPAFTDMKVDRTGKLWLGRSSSAAVTAWHVLLSDGRRAGTVMLASNIEPLDISDRHLVAVQRDSLGVETVLVYRFPRSLISQ